MSIDGKALVHRHLARLARAVARLDDGPPPGLRHGGAPRGHDQVVVVLALCGVSTPVAHRLLDVVRRVQSLDGSLVPVFLLDEPVMSPFRQAGYVVELTRTERLGETLEEMRRTYGASRSVVLADAASTRAPGVLEAALTSAAAGPPQGRGRISALVHEALRRL